VGPLLFYLLFDWRFIVWRLDGDLWAEKKREAEAERSRVHHAILCDRWSDELARGQLQRWAFLLHARARTGTLSAVRTSNIMYLYYQFQNSGPTIYPLLYLSAGSWSLSKYGTFIEKSDCAYRNEWLQFAVAKKFGFGYAQFRVQSYTGAMTAITLQMEVVCRL